MVRALEIKHSVWSDTEEDIPDHQRIHKLLSFVFKGPRETCFDCKALTTLW